jgi:translation initiation factor IF-1
MTKRGADLAARIAAKLPLRQFLVTLDDGTQLTAVLSPRVAHGRTLQIEIGEYVRVERSPYDAATCRIVAHGCDAERELYYPGNIDAHK